MCLCSASAGNAHLNYCTLGSTSLMPALGMQAEHQEEEEEEVGSEDGVPPIEAAGLGSNAGSLVAHIHSSAVAFPECNS